MKEFNLELALAGHPVVTKDGNEVTHLSLQEFLGDDYPLTGYIVPTSTTSWAKSGKYYPGVVNDPTIFSKDLFLKDCDWQPPIVEGAIVEVRDNPDHDWVERELILKHSKISCTSATTQMLKMQWKEGITLQLRLGNT